MKKTRTRHVVMFGGSVLVLVWLFLSSPELQLIKLPFGARELSWLTLLGLVVVGVALAYFGTKARHDYPEADARELFRVAAPHPIGAGLALNALAIVFLGCCMLIAPLLARAEAVPVQANAHLPALRAALQANWPDHPWPAYFGGLVDHESACPRPSSCWRPTARLLTWREEGCGMPQLTRAWRRDGTLRFDTLGELSRRHAPLRDLNWANCYARPDLQLQALVLMSKHVWETIQGVPDDGARLAMADSGYNAGEHRVHADRRACGLAKSCDSRLWWGHVELWCTASRQPIYGTRSACDINRHHVRDVLLTRAHWYTAALPGGSL
jgi:hypothetical protein